MAIEAAGEGTGGLGGNDSHWTCVVLCGGQSISQSHSFLHLFFSGGQSITQSHSLKNSLTAKSCYGGETP